MKNRNKLYLVIFLAVNICSNAYCQSETKKWTEYAIVSLGYQQSRVGFVSLDIGMFREHMMFNNISTDLRIAYAPRAEYFNVGVQSHYNFFSFLSTGISLNYDPGINNTSYYSIMPQIGIRPFGMGSIYYGFSFHTDQSNSLIQRHNLSITIEFCLIDKKGVDWFSWK